MALISGSDKTYDPDFTVCVGGVDVTKLVKRWRLEDVEDGLSSLAVTLGFMSSGKTGIFPPLLSRAGRCPRIREGQSAENRRVEQRLSPLAEGSVVAIAQPDSKHGLYRSLSWAS